MRTIKVIGFTEDIKQFRPYPPYVVIPSLYGAPPKQHKEEHCLDIQCHTQGRDGCIVEDGWEYNRSTNISTRTTHFVISPEVTPLIKQIVETAVESVRARWGRTLAKECELQQDLCERIDLFNSRPWYSKLWFVLTGGLV